MELLDCCINFRFEIVELCWGWKAPKHSMLDKDLMVMTSLVPQKVANGKTTLFGHKKFQEQCVNVYGLTTHFPIEDKALKRPNICIFLKSRGFKDIKEDILTRPEVNLADLILELVFLFCCCQCLPTNCVFVIGQLLHLIHGRKTGITNQLKVVCTSRSSFTPAPPPL